MKHLLCYSLLLLSQLCTAASQTCATTAQCNSAGTTAYQAGRYAEAIEAFERQLSRAENSDNAVDREVALNNLMLATFKAGQPGKARAWLEVALEAGLDGPATRHNLAKLGALDLQALAANPEGVYRRYAGQAAWSVLEISKASDGSYSAEFAPIRVGGAQLEEWGPAAIGELTGTLRGQNAYYHLESPELRKDCAVELLRDGLRLRVLETFAEGCQDYGGANISVGGRYYKVDDQARP